MKKIVFLFGAISTVSILILLNNNINMACIFESRELPKKLITIEKILNSIPAIKEGRAFYGVSDSYCLNKEVLIIYHNGKNEKDELELEIKKYIILFNFPYIFINI